MTSFTIAPLADPVGCYASWPSTANRVTRNKHGIFYAVETRVGNIAVGQPNDFQILWDKQDGSPISAVATFVNLPTNMVCVECFSTGELYLAYSDWILGTVTILCWADVTVSFVPAALILTGAGCASNGKIGTAIDEARRRLYVVGDQGWIFNISDIPTEFGRQQLFTVGASGDSPNYMLPLLDEDGRLYVMLCDAMAVGGASDYDCNTAVMTIDPGDIGMSGATAVWFNQTWTPGVSALALPIDPGFSGPAAWLTNGEQFRRSNSLLLSGAVLRGMLYACATGVDQQAEKLFGFDDLHRLTVETIAFQWSTKDAAANALIHRPVRVGDVIPRCASGGFAIRDCGVFLVVADRGNLICLKASGDGKEWLVYAVTPVPGLGTDTIHYISVARGQREDNTLFGMLTVLHCKPSQWAASTCPVPPAYSAGNPTATALLFSLETV